MALLKITSVTKELAGITIVNDISLEQQAFQKIAIAGETGSGKSTLLKMIAGWVQPSSGTLYFEGKKIKGPDEKLIPGIPEIAYLSQHFELRNSYRVEELLSYANKLTEEAANTLFEVCRISHLVKRKTDQLSGGERQRIAIARLLISAPKLLLLDEPYTNLDLIHKSILKNVIRDIGEKLQITCLMVSHDPLDIVSWADELILMQEGKIIQQGKPEFIYRHPVNAYAAALLGSYQLLPIGLSDAFCKQAGLAPSGKQIFVRPDSLKIVSSHQGIHASVKEVFFMAGFYELELTIANTVIVIRTMQRNIHKGDELFISLETDGLHFLD